MSTSTSPSELHERMVECAREARAGCTTPHRLGNQAPDRLPQGSSRDGWPDVVFAFHDQDEIGPRMLARLAKHTGLQPNDL